MYIDVTDNDRKKINGLSNSKLGSAILIDDVSSVTHEMSVKISSDTVTDLTAVKVTRCGKNLLYNDTIISESTNPVYKKIWSGNLPAPFVFSEDLSQFTPTEGLAAAATFRFKFADGTEKVIGKDYKYLLVTTGILKEIYFVNNSQGIGTIKCQLEIGKVKTDYEPYVGTDYTPNADGTVNGVTSLYPNTTLITDTDGVIINCEYLTKNYKYVLDKKINGLSNSKLGSTILIDDISPVTHEMSVKISSDTVEDLTAVKVTRCGKNLIPLPYSQLPIGTTTLNGIEFTVYEDGSILMNGTATTGFAKYLYNNKQNLLGLRAGDIITGSKWVSDDSQIANFNLTFNYYNIDGDMEEGAINLGVHHRNLTTTITEDYVGWGIYIYISSGKTFDNLLFKPQLELGKTATDYEPYVEPTEYTPNADGTVNGVTSIYPNTILITDTDGVIIDCEYLTNNYKPVLDNRIPKQTQSDWQQNDETANDYVKNRPGGYIDNDTIVKIPEKYLDIKNTNIVNGSAEGSIRSINSKAEDDDTYTIGTNAFAEGYGTEASGNCSHAEGYSATASGDHSHAEGWYASASGEGSHAEGINTTASGNYSHAEGWYASASGNISHAEGINTTASGTSAHAEGSYTIALGDYSHAQGKYNISNDTYADVIGNGTSYTERSNAYTMDWNGNAWFAGDVYTKSTSGKNKDEGSKKLATEEYVNTKLTTNLVDGSSVGSIRTIGSKEEDSSYKLGQYSVAEGYATEASGKYSHAEGSYTIASGGDSHAEGSCTTASGSASHAEGSNTRASGGNSHAEGFYTEASGDYSHAEGWYTTASGDYSHAQGRYNISNTTYADVIGNGTSYTKRSNAYTMDWNGNAWFAGDIYVGSKSGKNKDEGSKKVATIEEGTWPITLFNVPLGGETSAIQPTYTIEYATSSYSIIDNLVYVICDAKFIVTNAGRGYACIGGLPFISRNNASFSVGEVYGCIEGNDANGYTDNHEARRIRINQNTSQAAICSGSGASAMSLKSGYDSGGTYENCLWIKFSGTYIRG